MPTKRGSPATDAPRPIGSSTRPPTTSPAQGRRLACAAALEAHTTHDAATNPTLNAYFAAIPLNPYTVRAAFDSSRTYTLAVGILRRGPDPGRASDPSHTSEQVSLNKRSFVSFIRSGATSDESGIELAALTGEPLLASIHPCLPAGLTPHIDKRRLTVCDMPFHERLPHPHRLTHRVQQLVR